MLERFRTGAARLIAPLALFLNRLGVSPDLVTAVGTLGVMLGALICYPLGWLWQGTLIVTFFVLADMLDGQMAKMSGTASKWGAFLDSSLDRLGDGAVFGGLLLYFAYQQQEPVWAGFTLAALVLGQLTSYVRARAESLGFEANGGIAARADILAVYERDPACHRYLQPLLFFKGFQALQCFRIAHHLWTTGRAELSYFFQMRTSEGFGVDIHPGARIGQGVMIDHAHSIVIGETAVVGDNVSMLHSVTLGGTGKEDGDRHPKIGDGVLIGAGAKVLGNITVGHCSRIAAGSVVLQDVPPCKTVAGVPARIVGEAGCAQPSISMDQMVGG